MTSPLSNAAVAQISEWLLTMEFATNGASSGEEPAVLRVC